MYSSWLQHLYAAEPFCLEDSYEGCRRVSIRHPETATIAWLDHSAVGVAKMMLLLVASLLDQLILQLHSGFDDLQRPVTG